VQHQQQRHQLLQMQHQLPQQFSQPQLSQQQLSQQQLSPQQLSLQQLSLHGLADTLSGVRALVTGRPEVETFLFRARKRSRWRGQRSRD
jgi:hypothetical protein